MFSFFSPMHSYSSLPLNFQPPVESVWKISSRMVKISESYEQLEVEV